MDLSHAAPGFREALPLLRKGEKAVLWLPPAEGAAETLAYEVELVDVVARSTGPGRTTGAAPTSAPARSSDRRGT